MRHRWLDDGVQGTITQYAAVDDRTWDLAAVQWDVGGFEIVAIYELRELHPN